MRVATVDRSPSRGGWTVEHEQPHPACAQKYRSTLRLRNPDRLALFYVSTLPIPFRLLSSRARIVRVADSRNPSSRSKSVSRPTRAFGYHSVEPALSTVSQRS